MKQGMQMWHRQFVLFAFVLSSLAIAPSVAQADAITDYNLVITFYKQQKWKLASETAEDFLKKYPQHQRAPLARLYWGQALVHLQQFKDARDQFRTFVKDAPQHPDKPLGMYRIGECSYFLNEFETAEQELYQFITENPKHELVEWGYLYLGETQFRLNNFKASAQTFAAYRKGYPKGRLIDDVQYGLARAEEALGNSQTAIELYQAVAKRKSSPRAPEAQFNVGARYFDEKQYASAASAFELVTKKFSSHGLAPLAYLNAGYARYHLQEFDEAIQLFQSASQSPEQADTANYWIGLSHKSKGDFAKAGEVFQASLKAKPKQSLAESLHFQWGDAELRSRNFAKAIELFKTTVQKWPQGDLADDALHSACEAAFQLEDFTQAEQFNKLFVKNYPKSGLRLLQDLLYGRMLIAKGDQLEDKAEAKGLFEESAKILGRVAKLSSIELTANEARFQMARCYERLNEDEKVVETLDALLEKRDSLNELAVQDTLLLRANSLLRMKEHDQAIVGYQDYLGTVTAAKDKVPGLTGIVNSQIALKDWSNLPQSLSELKTADSSDQQFSRIAVAAGDAAFETGEWKASANIFQDVIALGDNGSFYVAALSGLGHARYEMEQFKDAAETFEALSNVKSDDQVLLSHAAYMVGLSRRRAEDLQTAMTWYQRGWKEFSIADEATPSAKQLEIGLNAYRSAKGGARTAREMQNYELADQMYEAAFNELKQQPPGEQTELDLLINEWADLSYNSEHYARSDEIYALLLKERPNSDLADDAQLILAESTLFNGNLTEARKQFEDLAQAKSSDEFVQQRSLIHLVDISAEESDWAQVLVAAKRLSTDFPNNNHQVYVKYRTGEALLQSKEISKAVDALGSLKTGIEADLANAPEWWPEAWLLLGEALYRSKKYDELNEVLNDLRSKAADSPVLYRADALLGQSYESQAKFEEAREAYTRVVDSKDGIGTESAAECQFRIAESYLKQKNYDSALKEYYKVYAGYESETYEPAALFQAGRCDSSLKNWRGAVQTYKILIEEFPQSEYAEKAKKEVAAIEKAIPELKETSSTSQNK